jgi:hypothetical protein
MVKSWQFHLLVLFFCALFVGLHWTCGRYLLLQAMLRGCQATVDGRYQLRVYKGLTRL